jgi:hypothetical protein
MVRSGRLICWMRVGGAATSIRAGPAARRAPEVLGLLLRDQPPRALDVARQPLLLLHEVVEVAEQGRPSASGRRASRRRPSRTPRSRPGACARSDDRRVDVVPGRALLVAVDHPVVEAALAVELGLQEPLLGVDPGESPADLAELLVDGADLAGVFLGEPPGVLDLGVDRLDLGSDRVLQLFCLAASEALSLASSMRWKSRWTCFQGRRWSAMIIQTMASVIAIEVIAKTTCKVGWLR